MMDRIYEIVTGWEFLSALVLILLLNVYAAMEKWKDSRKREAGMAVETGKGPFYVVDWDLR